MRSIWEVRKRKVYRKSTLSMQRAQHNSKSFSLFTWNSIDSRIKFFVFSVGCVLVGLTFANIYRLPQISLSACYCDNNRIKNLKTIINFEIWGEFFTFLESHSVRNSRATQGNEPRNGASQVELCIFLQRYRMRKSLWLERITCSREVKGFL